MAKKSVITNSTTTGVLLNSATYSPRVEVAAGVTVANDSLNGTGLYGDSSADWAITNFGTITGELDGVRLLSGSVTNIGGVIGAQGGVDISGVGPVSGTVKNNGTISGRGFGVGISSLGSGDVSARVMNDGSIGGGLLISGSGAVSAKLVNQGEISIKDGAAAAIDGKVVSAEIINRGTMSAGEVGSGIIIQASDKISVKISNVGTIAHGHFAGTAVGIFGGDISASVVNTGNIAGGGGDASFAPGIDLTGSSISASITNDGSIGGRRAGVSIMGSGPVRATIVNGGTIAGARGFSPSPIAVGISIAATGPSDDLRVTITNSGSISGLSGGVTVTGSTGAAEIVNRGMISGGTGIAFTGNYGSISGTVTNIGTIAGTNGTAIQFGAGDERLIVDPGAVFAGKIVGGTGSTTLELEKRGSAQGTVGGVTNFSRIEEDGNTSWSLTDSNSLTPGAAIDLGKHAVLTVTGTLDDEGNLSLAGGGALAVGGAGSVEIGPSSAPAAPGTVQVDSGAVLSGTGTITGAFVDDGTISATAGLLDLNGNVTGSGMMFIGPDSTLSIAGTIGGPGIGFLAGQDETLALGRPASVLSTISGFGAGDTIDLLSIGKATSASFAAGVLHVASPGGPVSLNFAGSYATDNFVLSSDHHGGTNVTWHA